MGILWEIGSVIFKPIHMVLDAWKAVVSDGYNYTTSRIGNVVDFTGRKVGDVLNATGSVIYNAGAKTRSWIERWFDRTVDKTGKAIDGTRHATQSLAKYGREKWWQAAWLVGDAVKTGAWLAGDLAKKGMDVAGNIANRPWSTTTSTPTHTEDYILPDFQRNPVSSLTVATEDVLNMGVRTTESVSDTGKKLFNILYEWNAEGQSKSPMSVSYKNPNNKKKQYAMAA